MRVGFDFRPVVRPNSRHRGIGKFTISQIQHLLELQQQEFFLYSMGGARQELPGSPNWVQVPQLSRPQRLNWAVDRLLLHRQIKRDSLDLYHATEVTALPRRCSCPLVVTIHDAIPLVFWDKLKSRIPLDYRIGLRNSYRHARRADRILTISHSAKRDICSFLDVPDEQVAVSYPGCNPIFRVIDRRKARQSLQELYAIEQAFLFYVGGSDFRKNLTLLLDAFGEIRKEGYRGVLVLAGETFATDIQEVEALKAHIGKKGLADCVVLPGYVPDQDLPLFYAACDAFVFPSLYEGFGLPVLEALACSALVLTSNRSSIPEVAGNAAVYFDPAAPENLVDAFFDVFEKRERAEELRQAGPVQAARFTWGQHAREVMSLYESLA